MARVMIIAEHDEGDYSETRIFDALMQEGFYNIHLEER